MTGSMLTAACGYVLMLGLAWLLSNRRDLIPWRVVIVGTLLQFGLALVILKTSAGRALFENLGAIFESAINCTDAGCILVFGKDFNQHFVAFKVLPIIIVFSALTAVLYHVGILGQLTLAMGYVMQRTLGLSGAECMVASANVFVGQTSAPLVARPFLAKLTRSELMCIMATGFATIAGNVMAAYIGMGIPAVHLLTASVINAPAALVIAKLMFPETETPETSGKTEVVLPQTTTNVIHAISTGTMEGLQLALSVGAMLIAFVALVTMANGMLTWSADFLQIHLLGWEVFDGEGKRQIAAWTFERLCGYAFRPFAFVMGIESKDVAPASELLGLRLVTNEFLAYDQLGRWMKEPAAGVELSPRTANILTYALCGFANLGSIGVQIGGLAPIMPSREADLARLGLRAMTAGMLACFMTACIASMLL